MSSSPSPVEPKPPISIEIVEALVAHAKDTANSLHDIRVAGLIVDLAETLERMAGRSLIIPAGDGDVPTLPTHAGYVAPGGSSGVGGDREAIARIIDPGAYSGIYDVELVTGFVADRRKIAEGKADTIIALSPPQAVGDLTETQIKHLTDRFLSWKLPPDFRPDGGVTFDADGAKKLNPLNHRYEPYGTNLLDSRQAEAMVRHMLEGLPER